MKSGHIPMEVVYQQYYCVLEGDQVSAWRDNETDAFYQGSIDGLQTANPELFAGLLEKGAIKQK